MRATTVLVAITALCAGCEYLGGWAPAASVTRTDVDRDRPCAWLPDEVAQTRLRRSAVGDKVRRLLVPALQSAELDAWLLVERASQRDPMFDSLGLTDPGDKAALFVNAGSALPRAFGFGSSPATLAQLTASGLFERVQPLSPASVQDVLAEFRPGRIGIDYSGRVALADGIATGTRQFAAWLVGREYAGTFRSAETAAVTFRAGHTPDEIDLARQAARCAVEIADRALDGGAIEAGRTTGAELSWRILHDIHAARLDTSAPPHVSAIKLDDHAHLNWPWLGPNTDTVIATGDLVHLDFDVRYAGVASTLQRTAYVLKRWESSVPADLHRASETLGQVRAGLAPMFRPGVTGATIANDAAQWVKQNRVAVELVAHPIGSIAVDVGTLAQSDHPIGPYDPAGALTERPLQDQDLQALGFRVTVGLDNGQSLTLSASDDGVVGFGGLDFLAPPVGILVVPRA